MDPGWEFKPLFLFLITLLAFRVSAVFLIQEDLKAEIAWGTSFVFECLVEEDSIEASSLLRLLRRSSSVSERIGGDFAGDSTRGLISKRTSSLRLLHRSLGASGVEHLLPGTFWWEGKESVLALEEVRTSGTSVLRAEASCSFFTRRFFLFTIEFPALTAVTRELICWL